MMFYATAPNRASNGTPKSHALRSLVRHTNARYIQHWTYSKMRKIALLAFLTTLTPLLAFAEAECADRPECWPAGSAMDIGLSLVKQQQQTEKILANKHRELIKLVASSAEGKFDTSARVQAALKTQQAAWLKYRSEECELVGSLTGGGGSWPSTHANECEVNHTDQRLRRVRSAIRCIKRIPFENRLEKQNACLQQLAPLTNK